MKTQKVRRFQRARKTTSSAREQPRAQRQEEIQKAAFEIFATHGFEAARMDDVARRAGVAKGTIYLYFPDKERLFQAVVRGLIPKRLDVLVESLPGPPAAVLKALLTQIYQNVVANEKVRAIARMLVAEIPRFPQLAEIYHQEVVVPGMRAMRQVLQRGMASGEFRKSSVSQFPQIVAGPALLALLWQLVFGNRHPLDLETYMKTHLEFALSSLERDRT